METNINTQDYKKQQKVFLNYISFWFYNNIYTDMGTTLHYELPFYIIRINQQHITNFETLFGVIASTHQNYRWRQH